MGKPLILTTYGSKLKLWMKMLEIVDISGSHPLLAQSVLKWILLLSDAL